MTIILFILLVINLLFFRKFKQYHNILQFLLLLFISAFRYGVGSDYFNYKEWIENNSNGYIELIGIWYEPLYSFFAIVINQFKLSSQVFFFITSFLFLLNINFFLSKINKITVGIFLFFLFGIYYDSFNTIRQSLAMSFLLISTLYTRNIKIFIFLVFMAFSIHIMSIIGAIFLLPFLFKLNKSSYLILFPVTTFALFYLFNNFNSILNNFDFLSEHDLSNDIQLNSVKGISFYFYLILFILNSFLFLKYNYKNILINIFFYLSFVHLNLLFFVDKQLSVIRIAGLFYIFPIFIFLLYEKKQIEYFLLFIGAAYFMYFLFVNQMYIDFKLTFQ